MSCCPPAPKIIIGDSSDDDVLIPDSEIIPGESVECYMKRTANQTGREDDKTEDPPNKIKNNDIPVNAQAAVDVTFRLTPNSTRIAAAWKLSDQSLGFVTGFPPVTFTSNGATARLIGTFSNADLGKPFKIKVSAFDADGQIDERGFTFSPAKGNGSNEIQFLHPLPGAIVTSPYGPRKPPAVGASDKHGGADFAYGDGKVGAVLAAADGEVIFTGYEARGAGNFIKIKHLNGQGRHLCTTVYMHLAEFYVKKDQKVSAGQKIGLEGDTGIGTGPHLHFECRLPDNSKIEPTQFIRGSLKVAQLTNPNNTARVTAAFPLLTQFSPGVLTPENVTAKQGGCEPFGPTYPKDPDAPTPVPPPANIADPFEKAWFFTMKHEVGPFWSTSSPVDPEVAAGLIATPPQIKKVGYVNRPAYPGGETKFGIAQGPNPNITVRSIDYLNSKKVGYNNYWKRGPSSIVGTHPKTAVMLFDLNYLHGVGNANTIRSGIVFTSMSDNQAIEALSAAQKTFMQNIVIAKPDRHKYLKGWLTRNSELLAYVKSL